MYNAGSAFPSSGGSFGAINQLYSVSNIALLE
jgi:hypothetical protein